MIEDWGSDAAYAGLTLLVVYGVAADPCLRDLSRQLAAVDDRVCREWLQINGSAVLVALLGGEDRKHCFVHQGAVERRPRPYFGEHAYEMGALNLIDVIRAGNYGFLEALYDQKS